MRVIKGPVSGYNYVVVNDLSRQDAMIVITRVQKLEELARQSAKLTKISDDLEKREDKPGELAFLDSCIRQVENVQGQQKIIDDVYELEKFAIQNCIELSDTEIANMDPKERDHLFHELVLKAAIRES